MRFIPEQEFSSSQLILLFFFEPQVKRSYLDITTESYLNFWHHPRVQIKNTK